ncbi:MAG: type II toxin-antitoxin system VapC family toxin [Candidatus Brockarchaeota archaeon]|nr:type II toxin-antitoxin system VapC family toxin [Candidatus Brockarchaeota archaeon]
MAVRRVYLDSSAITKRYVKEEGTETAQEIYSMAETGSLMLIHSIWNVGEVLGVLDQYRRRGWISDEQHDLAVSNFASEVLKLMRLSSLTIMPVASRMAVESWPLIQKYHIYVADALQIITSKYSRCDVMITADESLVDAARSEGLKAFNLESQRKEIVGELRE